MFCKECGTDIPDDAEFCPFCGIVLEMEVKRSQIENQTLNNKLEEDFDLHLDWVSKPLLYVKARVPKSFCKLRKLLLLQYTVPRFNFLVRRK